MQLSYTPLEKLAVPRPVHRIAYLVAQSRNKRVLDVGCMDETAVGKKGSGYWLHEEIRKVADATVGIDLSDEFDAMRELLFDSSEIVIKGDATQLDSVSLPFEVDTIVAGEFIEHLPDTLSFLRSVKQGFAGKQLICSTPNSTSLTNVLIGLFKRENCHVDHLQVYSVKTLNTLCIRAGFSEWEIVPYYALYTEMILRNKGLARLLVAACERTIQLVEWLFPMLSGGLILHVKKV